VGEGDFVCYPLPQNIIIDKLLFANHENLFPLLGGGFLIPAVGSPSGGIN
jgi:hypothetical protein